MMEEQRPDPEALLQAVQRQEKHSARGALKIFLGMAAGVGKTYAMLQESQKRKSEGLDIIVGTVSTHGREETEALLEGLTQIPEKKVSYKGHHFSELDIDGILARKPTIAVIDELAHHNVPGSRHFKRWQDVMELLDNGIDVYTTLNVQHIESLKDIIEHIAGITIRETVPDSIVETAMHIELIDITPDELLLRLKEGKVYLGDKSEIAAKNFFQADRLTALREIVLRYAAEKIDHDLQEMVSIAERASGWKTRERLMVAISHHTTSQKLIRTARRLASNLNAPWIALHVNDNTILDESERKSLKKNLSLANDLGGEVITTNDVSVIEGVERVARQRGITQIILGRSPTTPLASIFHERPIIDRLVKQCPNLDIHIVRQERSPLKAHWWKWFNFNAGPFPPYVLAFLYVCIFAAFNWTLLPTIGYKVVGVFFLISLLLSSLCFRKGPLFFASLLYAAIWDFFFIEPSGSFKTSATEDLALLLLYLLTAITTGILVDRARGQKDLLAQREETTQALYDIVREIAEARTIEEAFSSVKVLLGNLLKGSFDFVIKRVDNGLIMDPPSELIDNQKDKSALIWVYENGKEAGWSTETLPLVKNLYLPMKSFDELVGVIIFNPHNRALLSAEEFNFLFTVSRQLANFVERSFAEEREMRSEQFKQIDMMQRTILERIAGILQQPLEATKSALEALEQLIAKIREEKVEEHRELFQQIDEQLLTIETSSVSQSKTLSNVLAMANFTEGLLPINKTENNIAEFIADCCSTFQLAKNKHTIVVDVEEGLPEVPFDYYLVEVLLLNLMSNAIENSPKGSQVTVSAAKAGNFLQLSVADQGKGVPEGEKKAIFERFYRLPSSSSLGVGLGLTIAKTIAELHGGNMTVKNLAPAGAQFTLSIPLAEE